MSRQGDHEELAHLEREIQTVATAIGFDGNETEDIEKMIAWEKRGSWVRRPSFPQKLILSSIIISMTIFGSLLIYLTSTEQIALPPYCVFAAIAVVALSFFVLYLRVLTGMKCRGKSMRVVNKAGDVSGTLRLHGTSGVLVFGFIFGLMVVIPIANLCWSREATFSVEAIWGALTIEPEIRFLIIIGLLGSGYCLSLWVTRVKDLVIGARGEIRLRYANRKQLRELRLHNFRHVRVYMSSGSNIDFPVKIVISNIPGKWLRSFLNILPILRRYHVVLRISAVTTESGGPVNPFALDMFFRQRCRKAGFEIREPNLLWIAGRGWITRNLRINC